MPIGCTNPNAANYDPLADQDDGSCIYLFSKGMDCLKFEELTTVEDKSFTLSYSLASSSWVWFHDYTPDLYFHTRTDLYALKGRQIYQVNAGDKPGVYTGEVKPFFVDIAIPFGQEAILEAIHWVGETLKDNRQTLTHISAWNSRQHTGRIPLSQVLNNLEFSNLYKASGKWSFNELHNTIKASASIFLDTIFNDYAALDESIDILPWYEKELLEDDHVILRLEFDNTLEDTIFIHDIDISLTPTPR